MRIAQKLWKIVLGASLAVVFYIPSAYAESVATYQSGSDFSTNSAVVAAIEPAISPYLMVQEVQQFAYNIYSAGAANNMAGLISIPSTGSAFQSFVSKHMMGYCSPNIAIEQTQFSCKGQGGSLSAADAQMLELGDIRTSVLLQSTAYDSGAMNLTAQNLIRTLVTPFPDNTYTNMIQSKSFATDNNKQKSYAQYLANQALLGVALYSFDQMFGIRSSTSDLGLSSVPNCIPTATTSCVSGNGPDTVSLLSAMESEASRRFLDGANYVKYLYSSSPQTTQSMLLAELAQMQAFQIWMQYQSYRQHERMEALLATLVSAQVNAQMGTANALANAGGG